MDYPQEWKNLRLELKDEKKKIDNNNFEKENTKKSYITTYKMPLNDTTSYKNEYKKSNIDLNNSTLDNQYDNEDLNIITKKKNFYCIIS